MNHLNYILLLGVLIASLGGYPRVATASSSAEKRSVCLNPAPSAPVKTEADGECIECIKNETALTAPKDLQVIAAKVDSDAIKKRDLKFLQLMEVGYDVNSLEYLTKRLAEAKQRKLFNEIVSVDAKSKDGETITKLIKATSDYDDLSPKKFTSASAKNLLSQLKPALLVLDKRIEIIKKKILEKPTEGNYTIEAYEKRLSKLQTLKGHFATVEAKLKSSKSKIEIGFFYYFLDDYFEPFDFADLNEKVAKLEEQVKAAEDLKSKSAQTTEDMELKKLESVAWSGVQSRFEKDLCGLTIAEMYAIYDYTSSGYRQLNEKLRSGGEVPEKYRVYKEVLNSALAKLKPFEGEVKRGVSKLPFEVFKQHAVGEVISYEAFTSSSTGNGFGASQRFIIQSKRGRYVDPISSVEGEKEVIFPAGTKFKVLNVEPGNSLKSEEIDAEKYQSIDSVKIILEEVE